MAATEPVRDDLRIRQGKTWSRAYPVLAADGTAVSLAGYTAKAQIRDGYAGTEPLFEWTVAGGTMALTGGQVVLSVPAATSAAWAWRLGRWDLELIHPAGDVIPLAEGAVVVYPEVSRVDAV